MRHQEQVSLKKINLMKHLKNDPFFKVMANITKITRYSSKTTAMASTSITSLLISFFVL
jgi:hypothetical protein